MNVMLDYETFDTAPSTVVLSLGVVVFDESKIIEERYFKFDVQRQINQGRTISLDTLRWWMSQDKAAQAVIKPDSTDITLKQFVRKFTEMMSKYGAGIKPWSNGADFDLPITTDIFNQYGAKLPWMFWNSQCFRTYCSVNKVPKLSFDGATKHNALDDARNQTQRLLKYWGKK